MGSKYHVSPVVVYLRIYSHVYLWSPHCGLSMVLSSVFIPAWRLGDVSAAVCSVTASDRWLVFPLLAHRPLLRCHVTRMHCSRLHSVLNYVLDWGLACQCAGLWSTGEGITACKTYSHRWISMSDPEVTTDRWWIEVTRSQRFLPVAILMLHREEFTGINQQIRLLVLIIM